MTLTVNGVEYSVTPTVDGSGHIVPYLRGTIDVHTADGTVHATASLFQGFYTAQNFGEWDVRLSVTAENTGTAPLTIAFAAGTPITPLFLNPPHASVPPVPVASAFYSNVCSGLAIDHGSDGISVLPTQADADGDGILEIFVGSAATAASGLQNLGVDAQEGLLSPGFFNCNATSPIVPIDPEWTFLQSELGFTLSPGDGVQMRNAQLIVPAVPEPALLALLVTGLFAAANRVRRRRDP